MPLGRWLGGIHFYLPEMYWEQDFYNNAVSGSYFSKNRQGRGRKICGEEKVGLEKNNLQTGEKSQKFSVRPKYKTRKNVLVKIWKTEKSQNQLCQLFEKIRKSARTTGAVLGDWGCPSTSRFRICSTNTLLATS